MNKNKKFFFLLFLMQFLLLANFVSERRVNLYQNSSEINLENNLNTPSASYEFEYNEDFLTKMYIDRSSTNGVGWGEDYLSLATMDLQLISSTNFPDKKFLEMVQYGDSILCLDELNKNINILNVSNKQLLSKISEISNCENLTLDFDIFGRYLLCADDYEGLEIFKRNISGEFQYYKTFYAFGSIIEIEIKENYAVLSTPCGIEILDIFSPDCIKRTSYINANYLIKNLRLYQEYLLFFNAENATIYLYSIGDPYNTYYLDSFSIPNIKKFEVVDNFIITLSNSNKFSILDFTNPMNLKKIDEFDFDEEVFDFCIKDNVIYASVNNTGLMSLNISSSKLRMTGTEFSDFTHISMIKCLSGSLYAFDYYDNELIILNDSKKINYENVYHKDTVYAISDAEVKDDLLYVCYEHSGGLSSGWSIYNISNPNNPKHFFTFSDAYNNYKDIYIKDDFIYLSGYSDGLEIFNISNPSDPKKIGQYKDNDNYSGKSYVLGEILFIADGLDGLNIVNISNPQSPILLEKYDTGGWAYSMVVSDHLICLADGYQGVKILNYNISDGIQELSVYGNEYNNSRDIAIYGDLLYIADRFDGIEIVNITNPSFPQKIGQYFDEYNRSIGVKYKDSEIFISDSENGVEIVNVSDPCNPKLVRRVFNSMYNNDSRNCCLTNSLIINVNGDFGIDIFEYSIQNTCLFKGSNIFQSKIIDNTPSNITETKISIKGNIPEFSYYTLEISSDNGENWEMMTNNSFKVLSNLDSDLIFRIEIGTTNEYNTPIIEEVIISYVAENSDPIIINKESLVNQNIWTLEEDFLEVTIDLSDFCFDYEYECDDLIWFFNSSSELAEISFDLNNPQLLTLNSIENIWGSERLYLFLEDPEGLNSSVAIDLIIHAKNDIPIFIPDQIYYNFNENTNELILNLTSCYIDVDSNIINHSVFIGNDQSWEVLTINSNESVFFYNLSDLNDGTYDLKIIIDDGEYQIASILHTELEIKNGIKNEDKNPNTIFYIIIGILVAGILSLTLLFFIQQKRLSILNNSFENERFSDKISNNIDRINVATKLIRSQFFERFNYLIHKLKLRFDKKYAAVDKLLNMNVEHLEFDTEEMEIDKVVEIESESNEDWFIDRD